MNTLEIYDLTPKDLEKILSLINARIVEEVNKIITEILETRKISYDIN